MRTRWIRYMFSTHLTHAIPVRLERAFRFEMFEQRDAKLRELPPGYHYKTIEPIDSFGVDFGGSCHMKRPIESVMISGLDLKVPSEFAARTLDELRDLPARRLDLSHEIYYKFRYWNFALVLLPQQRASLIAKLKAIEPAATATASAFYRANAHPRENLIPVLTDQGIVLATPPLGTKGPFTS